MKNCSDLNEELFNFIQTMYQTIVLNSFKILNYDNYEMRLNNILKKN